MNILMMTNTYLPHVGGVAKSVEAFSNQFRARGHRVLIIAPEFAEVPDDEVDVVRVPAIQNFNGTDFSVRLPVPGMLKEVIAEFAPHIVHAHHPFLLGDAAQRVAARRDLPLVFTHHTMYERYTHYVPGDSPAMQRFVKDLATHYANLCNQVIAPSESIAAVLRHRGVTTPIASIPTGVNVEQFATGDGRSLRDELGIDPEAFVVGHLGRLAPEKNLPFLAEAVGAFLRRWPSAHFVVVGSGPSEQEIVAICRRLKVDDRVHLAGVRKGEDLVNAYHAMNAFAFASTSETQGMVVTEAMAAGLPVVAVDAPGAREVVTDGVNGRLIASQDVRLFVDALYWIADHDNPTTLQQAARQTAQQFSMGRCADRVLAIYDSLCADNQQVGASPRKQDVRTWEATLRLIEAEYHIWSNRGAAVASAIQGNYLIKTPILRWISYYRRRFRQLISRNEWTAKLFKLSRSEGTAVEPGLIMIQVDGLSRSQLQNALATRKMPFLQRLLDRESYRLHTLYSGLPSSTPAVQGELFYGVRGAVPAFGFQDHRTGKTVRMYEPDVAADVQSRLAAAGPGLLEGGSSYGNVYSGGAEEPRFCAATFGWGDFLRAANPLSIVLFLVCHTVSFLRILGLSVIETALAVIDFFRSETVVRELGKELKFVPTRVGICVLMRELNAIGASIDATRGLPIIHANFLGYDEQAHRRGPSSAFAHWSLKGIDHAIRRIWDAANRSSRRDYLVWIYSDHGQEDVIPYGDITGEPIEEVVARVAAEVMQNSASKAAQPQPKTEIHSPGVESKRFQWLGPQFPFPSRLLAGPEGSHEAEGALRPNVVAAGPVAHVYLPDLDSDAVQADRDHAQTDDALRAHSTAPRDTSARPWSVAQRRAIAERLVNDEQVPCAVVVEPDGVRALTKGRCIELPQRIDQLVGDAHPFLRELGDDLVSLCQHEDAGDIVLCGWCAEAEHSVSFPQEHGAHAGAGPEETRAFALLPAETPPLIDADYLRPIDLRHLALDILHPLDKPRHEQLERQVPATIDSDWSARPASASESTTALSTAPSLRVLTYNVHSCIGMDGRMSPRRIARLIARYRPDVVALQEVDVGCIQSEGLDQAQLIARQLDMSYQFHAAWQAQDEKYGNVILSRLPMDLIDVTQLPQPGEREPRGAMWAEIELAGQRVWIVNTHLGLSSRERMLQINDLLTQPWCNPKQKEVPLILCGDFNTLPRSRVYRRLCQQLSDAQVVLNDHRPAPTWTSAYPLGRLDHVFVSSHFDVLAVDIRRSQLARVASDHLPMLVELQLRHALATRDSA